MCHYESYPNTNKKDESYRTLSETENIAIQLYKPLGNKTTAYVHPFSVVDPENEPKLSMVNRLKWTKAYETERLAKFVNKTGMIICLYVYITIPLLYRFPIPLKRVPLPLKP